MMLVKRILGTLFFVLAFALTCQAQLVSQGQETTVTYTGAVAALATNTPAPNFTQTTGQNTFILSTGPTKSATIYITNNTANACSGAFQVTVASTGEQQISSFNNSLQAWQIVPVVNQTSGTYANNTGIISLPALTTTQLATAAIPGIKVAVIVNNTIGGCSTTTLDVVIVFTPIAVTSPLFNVFGNGSLTNGLGSTQVQGVVPPLSNGGQVDPIVSGGLQLATNSGGLSVGIDTSTTASTQVITGSNPVSSVVAVAATPSRGGELGILFEGVLPATSSTSLLTPWTGLTSPCGGVGSGLCAASIQNITGGQTAVRNWTNPSQTGLEMAVEFNITALQGNPSPVVRNASIGSSGCGASPCAIGYAAATLAGSTMVSALLCTGSASDCVTTSVVDTQGNTWLPLTTITQSGTTNWKRLTVYFSPNPSIGAANTVTWTFSGGGSGFAVVNLEITGAFTAPLVQPASGISVDTIGNQVIHLDASAPNQFNCSLTLTTNTTTQCQGAPVTVNGIPVRLYVTDIQINTTTAGTATTIALKSGTGSNCATNTANLSAIAYPNTTVALQSIMGARTPLIGPLQSAVCVTQAGTTPGTSVVELRGFLAP